MASVFWAGAQAVQQLFTSLMACQKGLNPYGMRRTRQHYPLPAVCRSWNKYRITSGVKFTSSSLHLRKKRYKPVWVSQIQWPAKCATCCHYMQPQFEINIFRTRYAICQQTSRPFSSKIWHGPTICHLSQHAPRQQSGFHKHLITQWWRNRVGHQWAFLANGSTDRQPVWGCPQIIEQYHRLGHACVTAQPDGWSFGGAKQSAWPNRVRRWCPRWWRAEMAAAWAVYHYHAGDEKKMYQAIRYAIQKEPDNKRIAGLRRVLRGEK